jgi:hypothetical protein
VEQDVVAALDALYETVCTERDGARAMELFAPDEDNFTWRMHKVRIEGGVAWVLAEGTLEVDGADAGTYRALAVLVERDGRWLWHTHHGSQPRPG